MKRRGVHSEEAPRAIGPYSQAVLSGDLLFCSGQVASDPAQGKIVTDDVAEQTRQVMRNLSSVLAAAEMTFDNVVRTTIYLASMDDFQVVNAVYGEFFEGDPPARVTVEVARLPLDARVEIDAVARA